MQMIWSIPCGHAIHQTNNCYKKTYDMHVCDILKLTKKKRNDFFREIEIEKINFTEKFFHLYLGGIGGATFNLLTFIHGKTMPSSVLTCWQ